MLSVGTLFLATACAGDDLDSGSDNADETTSPAATTSESESAGTSAGGPLTLAGQSFPEATLVAAMYEQLLENAGYDVTTKLVDSRDGYMADVPRQRRHRPGIRRRHRQLPQQRQERRQRRRPSRPATAQQLADDGKALLDEAGITLLDISAATDTNAFMVTQEYSDDNGVTKLSDLEGESVMLAAAPDCEGRLDCEGGLSDQYGIDVTEVLPLGYASDQTYQSVLERRVRARRDQHHRRHPGVPGPGRARGRQADPAGPEPRAGRLHDVPRRRTRTSPTSSTR